MHLAPPDIAELATICVNLDAEIDRHKPLVYRRGGYATVFQGTRRVDGIKVAIKTERYQGDGSTIKRILCEALVWSKLHHKNIVPLLGFATIFDASASLISPWQERGNAHGYVQDRKVDPRPLLVGVARGLDYLHSHASGSIVHSDLKGENVLIADDGRALLADFGSSFLVESSVAVTRVGPRRGGTPRWMAPELFDDKTPSVQSDIWAFGMTALELFTRQEPFQGISTGAVMARIIRGPPDLPAAELTCDRLTDAWRSICMGCWQQDPASRPSASDVLANIGRAISTNEPNSSGCHPVFPTVDLADDARQGTSSNRLNCSLGVDFEHPMNQEPSVSDREPIAMRARHFSGVGTITIGDHHISQTIDIGIPLSSVDHLHHTSHAVSFIRATNDLKVVSTLPSLDGRAQSDLRPPFDIEASEPRSTEPATAIQLAPVAQPSRVIPAFSLLHDNFYWHSLGVAGASILGWYFVMGPIRNLLQSLFLSPSSPSIQ